MKKTLLRCLLCAAVPLLLAGCGAAQPQAARQIGRASCRERV